MNPARSIGPALASADVALLALLPLYLLAPVLGGLLGAYAHGLGPQPSPSLAEVEA